MCQTVWIQVRPDVKSGLTWVQTINKVDQQTTTVVTSTGKGINKKTDEPPSRIKLMLN